MDDPYSEVKAHFADIPEVTVNSGKGAQGIKYGKKMFVMFYKGDITVQLPPSRVSELISTGDGLPHDPGTGTPMKNRVLIPRTKKETWIDFCTESLEHVRS